MCVGINVYSFALKPDATFYLRIDAEHLVPRVLADGGSFDYWESGMDLPMGEDLYESFIRYQSRIIEELDVLSRRFEFQTLDALRDVDGISDELCERVSRLLADRRDATRSGNR